MSLVFIFQMRTPTEDILLIMSGTSIQSPVIVNLYCSSLNPSMALRTINSKTRLTQRLTNIGKNHPKPLFQNNSHPLDDSGSIHLQIVNVETFHLPRMNNYS